MTFDKGREENLKLMVESNCKYIQCFSCPLVKAINKCNLTTKEVPILAKQELLKIKIGRILNGLS